MKRREFFDRRAESWDSETRVEGERRLQRVIGEAQLAAAQSVLDVGTGTGVLIPHILCEIGSRGRVVALDISGSMLAEARDKFGAANVIVVQADVHHLCAADASFDRVICNAAFPHFEDRRAGLREMIRALRPGGLLVISHPIGREAVNARHRAAGGPVAEDRVPAPAAMEKLLLEAGLEQATVTDEPEFYLARGRKRD